MFKDRDQAATELAARLAHLRGQRPLILAVPRGAVPMGVILATALEGDLDLILVRKLGRPAIPSTPSVRSTRPGMSMSIRMSPLTWMRSTWPRKRPANWPSSGAGAPSTGRSRSIQPAGWWWWWTTASPPAPR